MLYLVSYRVDSTISYALVYADRETDAAVFLMDHILDVGEHSEGKYMHLIPHDPDGPEIYDFNAFLVENLEDVADVITDEGPFKLVVCPTRVSHTKNLEESE